MHKNLLWTGRAYPSMEHCLLTMSHMGALADAVVIGREDKKVFRVSYRIQLNPAWETLSFELKVQGVDQVWNLQGQRDKSGWVLNGKPLKDSNECPDIDLSVTPFTNSLPINRLKLAVGESCTVKVLYLNVLHEEAKLVAQKYTRVSTDRYRFETVPPDFEAVLKVTELGIVEDYPTLFELAAFSEHK